MANRDGRGRGRCRLNASSASREVARDGAVSVGVIDRQLVVSGDECEAAGSEVSRSVMGGGEREAYWPASAPGADGERNGSARSELTCRISSGVGSGGGFCADFCSSPYPADGAV